jgi:hypothetical protein
VNLLVLDEPANHLDLPALEQLETYSGTLLLVTHDRRMLEVVRRTGSSTSTADGSPTVEPRQARGWDDGLVIGPGLPAGGAGAG